MSDEATKGRGRVSQHRGVAAEYPGMTSSSLDPGAQQGSVAASGGASCAADAPAGDLLAFLGDLRNWHTAPQRAGQTLAAHDAPSGSLRLALAALRSAADSDAAWRARPAQVVVFGPTQTGKSTIVNVLLGVAAAGVSPLAGFTVHAEAFVGGDVAAPWIDRALPGYTRVPRTALDRDVLDAFAVTVVPARPSEAAWPHAVWDTPDFDSLRSACYSDAVLQCVALADAPVVVLSREKYSDQTVWSLLRLAEPLLPGLIICLNKTRADSRDELVASLRERLAEQLPRFAAAPIVEVAEFAPGESAARDAQAAERLRAEVRGVALDRSGAAQRAARFCAAHWDAWLEGPRAEWRAAERWNDAVDDTLQSMLLRYRHDFVEHPQRFDALRRATAELLNLLEIPLLGPAMAQVRRVVSWPLRKLIAAGATAIGRTPRAGHDDSASVELLGELSRAAVDHLHAHALRAGPSTEAGGVWRALAQQLDAQREPLLARARDAARAEHAAMMREAQQAAGELYDALRERPAVLAALRTARATTDAAGIALSIKLGGAHVSDLIFAPALFAVTSMLAEGALGGHMSRVAARLRGNHEQRVRDALFEAVLSAGLRVGADRQAELIGLAPRRLDQAQHCLRRLLDERT